MKLPPPLEPIRQTRLWQKLRDWRYVRQHRTRLHFYRQFFPPGSLVFDIGANVGHYTLLFSKLSARVLAVEPQAELVAGLRRRFAGCSRVQVEQTALGAAASTATLHKAPGLSEVASLRADMAERSRFAALFDDSASETVPVTTLDKLIFRHGKPQFCKIDVEGYEFEVLSGLNQALPCLSLEMNREFWPETERCLGRLTSLGQYQFNFARGDNDNLAFAEWVDAGTLRSTIMTDSDPLLWGDIYARAFR